MKKPTYEDYLNMKIGTPLVVNVTDSVCDIGIFLGFNAEKGTAIVADCLMQTNDKYTTNVSEYKDVFMFPTEKEELLKLLQKKM
jgi:hypothetical protein